MDNQLFSVVILCYRHFEYLYAAIDSVINQNYPRIELIISDDGSDNFPRQEVEDYLQAHAGVNIEHIRIRREESNVGTVKHLNHIAKIIAGEYMIALAGDDVLDNGNVLHDYVEGFKKAPKECYIEMAQTGMYDENLEKFEEYYLKFPIQKAIEKTEQDPGELLKALIKHEACLPSTSTCFRREFFGKFGEFDENYTLIEDYPMHVRLARERWIVHYENFVAIKHRSGGISHGQKNALSRSSQLYFSDEKRIIEEIILKNVELLEESERINVLKRQKRQLLWLNLTLAKARHDYIRIIGLLLKHPGHTAMAALSKMHSFAYAWHSKLFFLCCALWIVIPVLSQMLNLTLAIEIEISEKILYTIALVMFAVWIYAFIVYWIVRLIGIIHRFPSETLAIG